MIINLIQLKYIFQFSCFDFYIKLTNARFIFLATATKKINLLIFFVSNITRLLLATIIYCSHFVN